VAQAALSEMMGNASSYGGSAQASVTLQAFLDPSYGALTRRQRLDWLLGVGSRSVAA
jgi:hypothetical protein